MSHPHRSDPDWRGPELVGFLLIVVGALWLLANSGLFVFLEWRYVWPVALIALGIFLVVQRARPGGRDEVRVEREGAGRLELQLAMGGGRLTLAGGATGLVEATAIRGDIDADVRRDGQRARVRLRQNQAGYGWFRGPTEWRVGVAGDVPLDLQLTCGAGDFDLDLAGVRAVGARISVGAARARLVLPRPVGELPVAVSTGAAHLIVEIPAGVEARIVATGGLISLDGRNETPGYGTASDRVTVSVSGGASSVVVR